MRTTAKIINNYIDIQFNNKRSTIALGSFDGVHCGHQYLINNMINSANESDLLSIIFTFSPHPRSYFMGDKVYKTLQSVREKEETLGKLNPDYVLSYPFNKEVASLSPAAFVDEILIKQLNVKEIWVGFNYHFGYKALGDTEFLKEYLSNTDIVVNVIDKITLLENSISTSRIKHSLLNGDIQLVNDLLGYTYHLSGKVIYGKQIGRTINFPTANINVPNNIVLPQNGVYAVYASVDDSIFSALMNIGNRPTVGEDLGRTVEVHILNQTLDLYGKYMTVYCIDKIRDEMKFPSLDHLKAEITRNCGTAIEILGKSKINYL